MSETATEVQLLPFQTSIPCPVKLTAFCGEGRWGLCVVELGSVLTGEAKLVGRPTDRVDSIHYVLGSTAITVNDLMDSVSPEKRADDLWPILPALFGTNEAGKYLSKGETLCTCCRPEPKYPYKTLADALGVTSGIDAVGYIVSQYAKSDGDYDWDRAVYALKVAVTIFWNEVKRNAVLQGEEAPTPQDEFLPEQIENLTTWLNDLKSGVIFDGTDGDQYDSTKTIREVA